jgi:hypothetical protein
MNGIGAYTNVADGTEIANAFNEVREVILAILNVIVNLSIT